MNPGLVRRIEMYKCDQHGLLESEWCDDCQQIIACDCSDITYSRFKDLELDSDKSRTVTVRIYHCSVCGEPTHAEI